MPIPGEKDRESFGLEAAGIAHEDGDDVVTAADPERTAWQKIVLDVGHEQGVIGFERLHRTGLFRSTRRSIIHSGTRPSSCHRPCWDSSLI